MRKKENNRHWGRGEGRFNLLELFILGGVRGLYCITILIIWFSISKNSLVAPSGRIVPLSERQQMALLKRIEEQRKQSTSPKPNDIQVSFAL